MARLLDPDVADRLRSQPLTYARSGQEGVVPEGFHHFSRTATLRRRDLDAVAAELLGWRVHECAGLRVSASAERAAVDEVVLMRLGIGPVALRIPCRVLEVIDDPQRRGFVYGTLPGHPESGEESFVLERLPEGTVTFTVEAFSRPATLLARAGGPFSSGMQRFMTGRYLAAPDRIA